jgi:hypothetical protein
VTELLQDLESWWGKARKTKRVSRALASAVIYGFAAGLSGGTGTTILLGCILFMLGGLTIPVKGQRHEKASLAAGGVFYIAGALIFIHPVTFQHHAHAVVQQQGALRFNVKGKALYQQDQSTVEADLAPPPHGGTVQPGEKVGTKQLQLVISNSYAHTVYVDDINVIHLRVKQPLHGTLFSNTAQGESQNDLMGVDLSQRRPVIRQMTVTGLLGDPLFSDKHIYIKAHNSEILTITMLAGAPQAYTWEFRIYYDAGFGQRSAIVKGSPGLLTLDGYVHSYGRVFRQGGGQWTAAPGASFCTVTGTKC